jgi:hypothetical protein
VAAHQSIPDQGIGVQSENARRQEHPMLDLIMLAIALGFFALSVGYTIACDRL